MLDANGTRHHLVLGQQDWMTLADAATVIGPDSPPSPAGGPVANTRYDAARVELTLTPKIVVGGETSVALSARRGAAADPIGNVYFIDPTETAILKQSAADGSVTTYWPTPEPAVEPPAGAFGDAPATTTPLAPASLGGLTVTAENYLIVGTTAPNALLVFDLQGAASPTLVPWTASTDWSPFQLAATDGGGVLILDRATQPACWRLNRAFEVEPADRALAQRTRDPGSFSPAGAGGGARGAAVSPPTSHDAIALPGDPISIAALRDWVLVLDAGDPSGPSLLRAYRHGVAAGDPIPLGDDATGTPIVGHDMTIGPPAVDETAAGHLYVASATRAQAFDFRLLEQRGSLSAQLTSRYLPLRSYGGRGVANGPRYDFGSYWVPLAVQPPASYASAATIVTRPFDGLDPGCTWHRLMIDAVLPPGSSVSVSSRAADDKTALAGLQFSPEPAPAPRPDGSEQPYVELPEGWSTYETLFQQARGRYLQLQLVISGNGRSSPRLRALPVSVTPGSAVDTSGQTVTVPSQQCADLGDWVTENQDQLTQSSGDATFYVVLSYGTSLTDPVAIPPGVNSSAASLTAPSRVQDSFQLELTTQAPDQTEQQADEAFAAWMSQLTYVDEGSATIQDLLTALAQAVAAESSPPASFALSPPPATLEIPADQAAEFFRAALRAWATELSPQAQTASDGTSSPGAILVGSLTAQLETTPAGDVMLVPGSASVTAGGGPVVTSIQLLQELISPALTRPAGVGRAVAAGRFELVRETAESRPRLRTEFDENLEAHLEPRPGTPEHEAGDEEARAHELYIRLRLRNGYHADHEYIVNALPIVEAHGARYMIEQVYDPPHHGVGSHQGPFMLRLSPAAGTAHSLRVGFSVDVTDLGHRSGEPPS